MPEKEEDQSAVSKKILKLAELIRTCKSCVVLTGAGISTSAGVSDFRGPNGVWTAEKKGVAPPASKSFDTVQPTATVGFQHIWCLVCGPLSQSRADLRRLRAAYGPRWACKGGLCQAGNIAGDSFASIPNPCRLV